MDAKEVVIERDEGAWVLTLRGEHDLSTATAVRDALRHVFDAGSAVVVDLSAVTFMAPSEYSSSKPADRWCAEAVPLISRP